MELQKAVDGKLWQLVGCFFNNGSGLIEEVVNVLVPHFLCSRKHVYPASSQTLLIRAMFITFGMEESRRDDYDTDSGLEHSEEDIYQQFVEFYEDVLPEFKSVGKVIQFK
eukprot:g45607.t1